MKNVRPVVAEISSLLGITIFCTLGLIRWAGLDILMNRFGDNLYDNSDSLFSAAITKMMASGDWAPFGLIKSNSVGAPFGFQLGDFPAGDQFFSAVLWAFSFFTKNPYIILNSFYFLSFYLCAFSFFYSARFLNIPRALAAALAVAFGLLPYHFYRYAHFFLAAYFFVPPLAVLVITLAQNFTEVVGSRQQRLYLGVGTLVLAALSGIYYAFFFCFFMTAALMIAAQLPGAKRRWIHYGSVMIIVMTVGILNYIPNFQFSREFGKNPAVGSRNINDSERGGLRLATFLLPTNSYFVDAVREKVREYQTVLPPVEGTQEYGGSLAVIGVLIALFALFRTERTGVRAAGLLIFSGILFATLGGLNIIFGLLITASFRSETRISVFLACFGLIAFGLFFAGRFRKFPPWAQGAVAIGLAVWILFDQIPVSHAGLAPMSEEKQADAVQFFQKVDETCAPDSAILQMPYTEFPETPPVGDMGPYEHFKAYIYSTHLRWSYGSMRGRGAGEIIRNLSRVPFDINELRRAGYAGVEVDLAGFPGPERDVVLASLQTFKTTPFRSSSGRFVFYAVPNSRCDH